MEWRCPLTLEGRLPAPMIAPIPQALLSPVFPSSHHFWGSPEELRVYPLILSRSLVTHKGTLATSPTEDQLRHFGATLSSITPVTRLPSSL